MIALKPDIISTFKLYEALCGYLEKKDLQLRKNAILDEGEIITYWNALLYAQNSKERFGILALAPIEKLDFETVESLIRSKKAAKLDAVFAILASNVPQDQSKRLSDERILIVNPRLTRFDIESELGKTVSPLIK